MQVNNLDPTSMWKRPRSWLVEINYMQQSMVVDGEEVDQVDKFI